MKNDNLKKLNKTAGNPDSMALESAIRMLARRDHTQRELTLKLRSRGYGRTAIDHALVRCRELGYLDDVKTAAVLTTHLIARGYGPLRIRHALKQRGLDNALIEKNLAICGDEAGQIRRAMNLLNKKSQFLSREADPWKRRQKAYRYLAGRGFPSAVIRQAVDDM